MDTPHTTTEPRRLLTVEQAAERLAIGRTSVFALIRTGELVSVRIGRLRRIPTDAIAAYINHLTGQQAAA